VCPGVVSSRPTENAFGFAVATSCDAVRPLTVEVMFLGVVCPATAVASHYICGEGAVCGDMVKGVAMPALDNQRSIAAWDIFDLSAEHEYSLDCSLFGDCTVEVDKCYLDCGELRHDLLRGYLPPRGHAECNIVKNRVGLDFCHEVRGGPYSADPVSYRDPS
jgi:hypothetical protein